MDDGADQMLACGLRRDGREHRQAHLRRIGPHERGALLDGGRGRLPAERISAVLEHALVSIGEIEPITVADTRELTIGDRDLLVLALCRLLCGPELDCIFSCSCGERLELTLDLAPILDAGPAAAPAEIVGDRGTLRAIHGAEHERASRLALLDRGAARRELATVCAGSPDANLDELDELLSELDPYAEIELGGSCPACDATATAILDPITHLWEELQREQDRLEREIHVLALNYHWCERDIVALAPERRARYLALLVGHGPAQ
ncbi:MAG: hypothetical protein ACRDNS_01790 [Trebonia sp.]